jgi:hypothetical protein
VTSGGAREPSPVVAWGNWLVDRVSGYLGAKTSRRGFLVRSAMAGSDVAVAGIAYTTKPGSAFTRITDCPPGAMCRDGYTEFCCVTHGANACPSGTITGGWWRADFSTFCNGTRYYLDCNEICCGPPRGYRTFCNACHECGCAGDCNTRKSYCTYFRYGQCNQHIEWVGPIACRMVTCTPPWTLPLGCTPDGAVDNETADHNSPCLQETPLPPAPTFALTGEDTMGFTAAVIPGQVWETFRVDSQGNVWHYYYPRATAGESELIAGGAKPDGDVRVVRQTTPRGGVGRADVWFERPDGSLGHVWQAGDGGWRWNADSLVW